MKKEVFVMPGLSLIVLIALFLALISLLCFLISARRGYKLLNNPPQENAYNAFRLVLIISYLASFSALLSILIFVFVFVLKITFNVDFNVNFR